MCSEIGPGILGIGTLPWHVMCWRLRNCDVSVLTTSFIVCVKEDIFTHKIDLCTRARMNTHTHTHTHARARARANLQKILDPVLQVS